MEAHAMKNSILLSLAMIVSLCCVKHGTAQSLNDVKIGSCQTKTSIDRWIATEERKGLVMDARPFAINQSKGKLLFTRGDGRVSVIHMNPFVYNYKISVAQQELVTTALTDFLKLILPGSLGSLLPTPQSGVAGKSVEAKASSKVTELETRLSTLNAGCHPPTGAGPEVCQAMTEMLRIFNKITPELQPASTIVQQLDHSDIKDKAGNVVGATNVKYVSFTNGLTDLRNEQLEAFDSCNKAQQINATLSGYDFNTYFDRLNDAQAKISEVDSLAEDLKQLAEDYNKDTALKDKIVRCNGFNCTNQFLKYADAVKALIGTAGYQLKLEDLRTKGQQMQTMLALTEAMKTKDGLFARSFDVAKKFELSQATISIKRDLVGSQQSTTRPQSGDAKPSAGGTAVTDNAVNNDSSEGTVGDSFGPKFVPPVAKQAEAPPVQESTNSVAVGQTGTATPFAGEVNEVVQLGRPRFMLSGGMVYSSLPRRIFKKVPGFVLDAQGNPTGKGDANVVGFTQNSPRRLFPMVFLNSRLLDYGQGSLYFSFGVTGKRDDNIDLEYLLGPSVSFLNDRAVFTFGAYGGMTQNLLAELKVGDEIPDSLGEAKLFLKRRTWKPGFSFSYNFSRAKKATVAASGSGSGGGSSQADLKNEIRIGSIPFNLALGLAVTSLEQRTYDPIAGFARDRAGNLTNGHALARIVGLSSSSNYRLSPIAMLHSRLTNFGSHDFYFSTGITGKKTNDDLDVEYLLGGSTNLYQRKLFLTFGTFIGKQQVLGGDFFEGQVLGRSQGVTTHGRYVWKPAIAFSYDISKILPRSN
jgi:hypothetical protein